MFIGFWRPIFLSPPHSQRKETEERHSVQQIDNKGEYIQQKLPKDFIYFIQYLENFKPDFLYLGSLRQYPSPIILQEDSLNSAHNNTQNYDLLQ